MTSREGDEDDDLLDKVADLVDDVMGENLGPAEPEDPWGTTRADP